MAAALAHHDALLTAAITASDGQVFQRVGDALALMEAQVAVHDLTAMPAAG